MAYQVKTFTGADVSLFHIAMRELGDALSWSRIAAANNISDPIITGTVDLIIPNLDPRPPDGLPIL